MLLIKPKTRWGVAIALGTIALTSAQVPAMANVLEADTTAESPQLEAVLTEENSVITKAASPTEAIATASEAAPSLRRLIIDLSERQVQLHDGEQVVASYPIAIGRSGWETPTVDFEVFQMVENPAWRHPWKGHVVDPGPENPLGLHWIGFWSNGKEVIGFHGTPNEASVGQAASHGCIRMLNADVAELFSLVSVGTSVTVVQ